MTTASRIVMVMSLLLLTAPAFAADALEAITVHVRLLNHARVSRSALRQAEEQVARIYAASGIQILWVADAPSTSLGRTSDVLLLSPWMEDHFVAAEGVPSRVLGLATRDAGRAFIFTDRTMALARHLGVDPADALGVVIAHELGHLLLPDAGHSATGLMQSGYSLGNSSARRFTPAEGDAIRQRLALEQSR
jgi:hypothetical protein